MDLNIIGIISKMVTDGVTWQETIVISLFFCAAVLIVFLLVNACVKIFQALFNLISTASHTFSQVKSKKG